MPGYGECDGGLQGFIALPSSAAGASLTGTLLLWYFLHRYPPVPPSKGGYLLALLVPADGCLERMWRF